MTHKYQSTMVGPCVSAEKIKKPKFNRFSKRKIKKNCKHRNNKANRPSDRDRQLIPRKRKLQFMPFGGTPWLSDRISVCLGLSYSSSYPVHSSVYVCPGATWATHFLLPHSVPFWPSNEPNWTEPKTIWMNLDRLLLLFSVNNKYNNYECVPCLAMSCGTCHDQKVALIFWFTVRSFHCPQTKKKQ